MTNTLCSTCARPTEVVLCTGCTELVLAELRGVPWLVEQLLITFARTARTGTRNGPRSPDRPLPYHHGASVDLETFRTVLAQWSAAIAIRRGIDPPTDADAAALSRWLLMWPTELASHPDAAELLDNLQDMTRAARRTIDLAPDMRYVGPCDGHHAALLPHEPCGEDLYVGLGAPQAVCRTDGCGATYPIEQRRAWLLNQAVDQLRTAGQLAYELPWIAGITITAKRIGMWATRGRLTVYLPHPRDPREAARFRVGEVIDHARAMAEQQNAGQATGAA